MPTPKKKGKRKIARKKTVRKPAKTSKHVPKKAKRRIAKKKARRTVKKKATKKKAQPKNPKTGFALLQELCDSLGPSGQEKNVRDIIRKYISPHVDDVFVDKMGNLFAHKKGKGEKVMLAAHLDEIAIMIKSINTDGTLRISPIGGIEVAALIGNRVSILNQSSKVICSGVITFRELHDALEITNLPTMENLYIDTGLTEKETKKVGIRVGSYAIPRGGLITLGKKDIISGKALDNRIGCYILIELARRLVSTNQNIYFVFTVQEEIGLYGAKTSLYKTNPDWGIAVDVTNASDSQEQIITVGNGPVVLLKDAEIITNACIDEWLRKIAKKKGIPIQFQVDEFGTTDATRIMMHKEGVPTSVMSVAVRNLHSTVGISSMTDIKEAIELLYTLLKKPPKVCLV